MKIITKDEIGSILRIAEEKVMNWASSLCGLLTEGEDQVDLFDEDYLH